MTFNQIVALAADVTFQKQIQAAAVQYAITAIAAAPTNHGAADAKSWALAASTLADGCVANLQRFVWGIAATPGFLGIVNDTGDQNDGAIASAMVSQWGNLAGETGGDLGLATVNKP
jgi:hypothetical protein